RLDDRDAEALEARGVDEGGRATVERRKLPVGGRAEPGHATTARLASTPASRADDAQLDPETLRGRDRILEVLARLERPDREEVLALRAPAVGRERRVDAGVRDVNAGAVDTECRRDVGTRELGVDDDDVARLRDVPVLRTVHA